jgi:hypothetical protein
MVICGRCKTKYSKKDNYCNYCGAPLKLEILNIVRKNFEERRRESVHNVLDVLVKSECINKDKLDELMIKLKTLIDNKPLSKPVSDIKGLTEHNSMDSLPAVKREPVAKQSSAEASTFIEGEPVSE